jgi:hypothetical protein
MKKLDELGCAQVRPDPVHHRVSFWDWGWTPPPFVKNGDVAALVPYGSVHQRQRRHGEKLSVEHQDKIVKVYDLRDTRS